MADVSSATRRQDRTSADYYASDASSHDAQRTTAATSTAVHDLSDLPWTAKALPASAFAKPAATTSSASSTSLPAERPLGLRAAPKDLSDADLAKEKNELEMRESILRAVPNDGRVEPEKVAGRLAALNAEAGRRQEDARSCTTARPTLVHTLPQHAVLSADELADCGTPLGLCLSSDQKAELEKARQATCRETGRDPFAYATRDADTISTDTAAIAADQARKRVAIMGEVASNPLAALSVIGTSARGGSIDQAYDGVQASAATWGVATALSGARPGAASDVGAATQPEPTRSHEEFVGPRPALQPMNEQHVLAGEINARGRATGLHAEPRGQTASTAQIVPGTRSAPDPNGVYQARVRVFDTARNVWVEKRAPSTFFPSSWSAARIKTEITGAYANPVPKSDMACKSEGDRRWSGTSPSGITIAGYADENGRIITAYPKRNRGTSP